MSGKPGHEQQDALFVIAFVVYLRYQKRLLPNTTEIVMKIFFADQDPLYRAALKYSLDCEEDMIFVGDSWDCMNSVDQMMSNPPDVCLIDLNGKGFSCLNTIKTLKKNFPHTKVMILSSYDDENSITRAVVAGADAYILKSIGSRELAQIARALHEGSSITSFYMLNSKQHHSPSLSVSDSNP